MKTLYQTHVDISGGRNGHATSDDGQLDMDLAMPRALGGSGLGPNPEQLFAAGFAACFNSSLRHAAKGRGLDAGDVAVRCTVTLVMLDDGAFGITAQLAVATPNLDGINKAVVIEEAKRICAYSNATRGNVETIVVDL
jgi:Ohr subfamily peroxiredoxin